MKNIQKTALISKIYFLLSLIGLGYTPIAKAQISNPALGPGFGGGIGTGDAQAAASGSMFVTYFIRFWNIIIVVGGLAVLVYFIWGAVDWIVAGGDASKIQKGRDRIIQSVIGMILLASSFLLVSVINNLFFDGVIDLLNFTF